MTTRLPKGVREIRDSQGTIRAYQGRVELPTRMVDGKPRRAQDTHDVPIGKGGRTAAIAAAAAWREQRLNSGAFSDFDHRTTLAEYALHYAAVKAKGQRENTADGVRRNIERLIVGHPIGAKQVGKVSTSHVIAWGADVRQGWNNGGRGPLMASSYRNRLRLLARIFKMAILDGLRDANPVVMEAIDPPKVVRNRNRPVLSHAQMRRLAAAMPPWQRVIVIVQFMTGLRVGEVLGLRVGDLHGWLTAAPTLRVDTQINHRGRRVEVKTASSHRTVPLDPEVIEALREHMAHVPPAADLDGLIFWHVWRGQRRTCNGYRHTVRAVSVRLHAADPTFPVVTSHLLRHSFGSHATAQSGGDVALVAELMGHVDADQVVDTYLHVTPGSDTRARRAIAAIREADSGERRGTTGTVG